MAEVTNLWRVIQAWLDELPFPPSQARIGEAVGVERSAVSDWKYGKTRPTPEHLSKLASLLEPQAGPDVYGDLLLAMVKDMGFEVPKGAGPIGLVRPADDKDHPARYVVPQAARRSKTKPPPRLE